MFEPVVVPRLRQHWPVLLALLSSALLLLALGLRAPRVDAPSAVPPPPVVAISVQITAADLPCTGTDAGACGHARTRGPERRRVALAGARVRAFAHVAGRLVLAAEGLSDASGQARLPCVPGDYWLLADASGRARRSEALAFDGRPEPLELVLPPAEPFEVNVRDPAGLPVAGATVLVRGDDALPHGARTAADGSARFEHVGPRVESVRVSAAGYDAALVNPTSRRVVVDMSSPAALEVRVLDPSGAAASAAEVWLSGIDFWPPRQALSGADGIARFDGLARGSYDLRAQLADSVSPALSGVTLERGQRERVTLQLAAGRFVSVHVRAGEGDEAAPVAGAEVTLAEDGLSPFPLSARTGPDGSVRLGPLAVGSAMLSVRADGFMPESVPVAQKSDADVNVALLRGGRISGRVLDGDGNAVEGARLEVLGNDVRDRPIARASGASLASGGFFERSLAAPLPVVPMGELGVLAGPLPVPGMPASGMVPRSAWVSDLDGNYRLDDVPPGRLRLLVRHPDFVETLSDTVSLEPGGSAEVGVVLARGASLSGRVLDELGRPVARARVDAVSDGAGAVSVLTGSDGSFSFRAVPPRLDLLVARPEQRQRFVLRRALSLAPGEARELSLALPAERAPLVVSVRGDDGRALSDATVSLLSLAPEFPLRLHAESDARGETQLADAVGIPATLRVLAKGFRAFDTELDPVPARVEVTLSRGVSVLGRVTQAGGRQGVHGAEVVLLQDGERRSTLSDENGEYELTGVALGSATLSVRHPALSSETWEVSIIAGPREDRALDLEPIDLVEAALASGRVVDARGEPVRGARVGVGLVPAFIPAGARLPGFVETDAQGRFELRDLAPGVLSLSAYAASAGRGRLPGVRVSAGEPATDLEIVLRATHAGREPSAAMNVAVTLGERRVGSELEVVIVNVAAGSEAERAGVRPGDVLWSVDDEVVADMADARQLLGGSEGSDVILELDRDAEAIVVRVRREAVR
jgi:hypothetical protein